MAEAPGGARTPRSDPGSGPPSEKNRLRPAGGAPTTPPGRAGGQNQDETKCHSTHLAPDSREPVFFALLAPKGGKYSDVTVPTPYRPTGAQVRPGPVLTIP